jgi:hypothetical protein
LSPLELQPIKKSESQNRRNIQRVHELHRAVILEKLTIPLTVKKFPTFSGTHKFILTFIRNTLPECF